MLFVYFSPQRQKKHIIAHFFFPHSYSLSDIKKKKKKKEKEKEKMLSALTNERRLLKVQNTIDLVLLRKTTIKRKTVSRSNSNNSNSNSEITNTKKNNKKGCPCCAPVSRKRRSSEMGQ